MPLLDDHVFSFGSLETSSAREMFGDCSVVSVSGFGMGWFDLSGGLSSSLYTSKYRELHIREQRGTHTCREILRVPALRACCVIARFI